LSFGVVLATGAFLRAYGVDFGLPLLSNFYIRPDESLIVQVAALLFERKGDPQFFAYPALMAEVCALIYAVMKQFVGEFAENPSAYFLAARWVSVIAGTLTIGVVWQTARLLCGWGWAVGAAALYAVCPLAVRDAHFGVTDSLVTLMVSLGLLTAVQYARQSDGTVAPLGAVAWMGLAVSSKYTAVLATPAMLAAVLERHGWNLQRALRLLALAAVLAAMIFAVLNPYVVLRFRETLDVALGMFGVFYQGKSQEAATVWSVTHALEQLLRPMVYGPGSWAGLLLAFGSLGWAVGKRRKKGVLTAACGTLPLLLALLPLLHPLPFRYVLPSLPGVAVLATFSVSQFFSGRRVKWHVCVAGCVLLLWQLAASVSLVRVLAQKDTRSQAGEWIARELPSDIPVVLLVSPEAEPQLTESATSIQRRIEYVYRMYGPQAGNVVSELYRLQLSGDPKGREVYRSPKPEEVAGKRVAVVTASYPLPMIGVLGDEAVRPFGIIRSEIAFDPFAGDVQSMRLDRIDAFLLPMNPAGLVRRPGPKIRVSLVTRPQL
jgi:hypothetical protein